VESPGEAPKGNYAWLQYVSVRNERKFHFRARVTGEDPRYEGDLRCSAAISFLFPRMQLWGMVLPWKHHPGELSLRTLGIASGIGKGIRQWAPME
jgi:hypothetical protein